MDQIEAILILRRSPFIFNAYSQPSLHTAIQLKQRFLLDLRLYFLKGTLHHSYVLDSVTYFADHILDLLPKVLN